MSEYTLTPTQSERIEIDNVQGRDICGVEMSDGSTCERPVGECPYHGEGD